MRNARRRKRTLTAAAAKISTAERRKVRSLVCALLPWFRAAARDLPWRRTRDPYAIWVSEVMLQQTQVATVVPFYERWMRALPNVLSLAHASSQRLHKLWEGLGYYTRVRNMQKAAGLICSEHGGRFPEVFEDVMALPGIGRYTAGAICSIAFNQPTPVLDGNVIRVLTRVFGIRGDPRAAETNGRLWQLAETLVQQAWCSSRRSARPNVASCSHLNQALMELGATVCTPRGPNCSDCPVRRWCVALSEDLVEQLPAGKHRPRTIRRQDLVMVLQHGDRYLAVKRAVGRVNGGLWEFPTISNARGDHPRSQSVGIRFQATKHVATIQHSITRYRITMNVVLAQASRPALPADGQARWVTRAELSRLAMSAAHRRIARTLIGSNSS